jgi:HEAT repeat protein
MGLGDASGQHIIASVVETGSASQMNAIASRMGKARKKEFLPLLEKALARPDAWQGVAYAVAYCGGKDAVPILEKALSHPNKGVRSGARDWIKRLSE